MKQVIEISKVGQSVTVDLAALPENIKHELLMYGLKQKLNDVHSSITAKNTPKPAEREAEVMERVNGLLAAWAEGQFNLGGQAGGKSALEREIDSILAGILAAHPAVRTKAKATAYIKANGTEKVMAALGKGKPGFADEIRAKAKARLEKPKGIALDIDLEGLDAPETA